MLYVFLTASGIFLLIGFCVLAYFRLFRKLTIEIVDNGHSFNCDPLQSNFVYNAVLFAYKPIYASSDGKIPEIISTENGTTAPPSSPKVLPAPGRSLFGILRNEANEFAVKHGVRVIALCRYVWHPEKSNDQKPDPVMDDSDDGNEASPFSPLDGDDTDMTKAALGALSGGDCRYIVGVVVSEAANESQLTYPSPLCEQLRAAGFTQFCVLPPLRTALRLRYAAGRNWRKSTLSRMATVLAGTRFYGSSREVIRQYNLKPPRSPLIVEFYDPNSAIFYLPLADEMDAANSKYLVMRLPPELTCPRPPPTPLPPTGGLLGSPPLPYKSMNSVLTPWDPYAEEGMIEEKKSKHSIERA